MGDALTSHKLCTREIILNFKPTFYRALDSNVWFYSVKTEKLVVQCPVNNTSSRTFTTELVIHGTGSLTIAENCYIHTDTFMLLPHTSETISFSDQTEFHIPSIGNIFNLIDEESDQPLLGTKDQISSLLKTITDNKFSPLIVPLHEWQAQLNILKLKPWYSERKHAFPMSMTAFLTILLGICIWKRVFILSVVVKLIRKKKERESASETNNGLPVHSAERNEEGSLLTAPGQCTPSEHVTLRPSSAHIPLYPSGIL